LSVIYVTVYIRHPCVGIQELLGQTCNFSPNSTIPKRGVIFVPKRYQILDLGPVYQDQHLRDSQEIISHQTDLELPTPMHPGILLRYLQGYDQEGTNYVVNGFTQGFSVSCLDFKITLNCRNLPSALAMPEIVSDKVAKESLAGRMTGPLFDPPFSNLHCSPLGLVPKKDPSKFRIIHHLSHPKGQSVNDFIPTELSSVQYTRIQDAILGIKQSPCFMAKCNIEMTYRN